MVNYVFELKVKGSNDHYRYDLDLTINQENNPEQVFTTEIRESLRKNLQEQSLCTINDNHLNQIITTWMQDIKEGYRDSTISLDLPLIIESNINQLNDQGNQENPALISPSWSDIEPQLGMMPPLNFC
jgi:hypothetical protein